MKRFIVLVCVAFLWMPAAACATAGKFEVTGWMPYWRAQKSINDVTQHLDVLTEVNPFVYTLKTDGTIADNGPLDQEPWASFIKLAKEQKVRVIPTIMSGSGDTIHRLLSNQKNRIQLEDEIAALVKKNNFDGIDIDFEGKRAETKNYFSIFLKGLSARMNKRRLMCTIESRTPIDSRYYDAEIPTDATIYANDFKAINTYCDRVRIMAYDQMGIDQALAHAAETSSEVYAPIADPRWVRKTIEVASKDISKSKLLIGVPTYGYEYDVTAYAGGQYTYNLLWSFNPGYVQEIQMKYGVTPSRNSAGEMFLTYTPRPDASTTSPMILAPNSAMVSVAAAALYADTLNSHMSFRLIDWPDAQSIAGKIELAQMLGVRGVSIFKLDGGEDPGIWSVLQGAVDTQMSFAAAAKSNYRDPIVRDPITRSLELGSEGEDVRTLQIVLNSSPATRVAASGNGSKGKESTYFGAATARALKKFQVKYGLAREGDSGYGTVGPATRTKLNTILGSL